MNREKPQSSKERDLVTKRITAALLLVICIVAAVFI
jgi:hypothetical protein